MPYSPKVQLRSATLPVNLNISQQAGRPGSLWRRRLNARTRTITNGSSIARKVPLGPAPVEAIQHLNEHGL